MSKTTTIISVIALVISFTAVVISFVAAFKDRIFSAKIVVITGGIWVVPTQNNPGNNLTLVFPLTFLNEGYADAVIQSLRIKITDSNSQVKSYIPTAEVDEERLIQGTKKITTSSLRGSFSAFIIEARKSVRKLILFAPDNRDGQPSFGIWEGGEQTIEIFVRQRNWDEQRILASFKQTISQENIDFFMSGGSKFITGPDFGFD
ncbi:MAG: hypothetical protein JSU77_03620 [Fidelibacterota bacterium]|nr:MAG: hypothetical protein JSU77_03620 [Candidatus Neomarinimicrobiota bacterium]